MPTSVVFPAPFGPISARTSPAGRSRSTPATACSPAKCLDRPRVESRVMAATPEAPAQFAREALRREEGQHHERHPGNQHVGRGHRARKIDQVEHEERADERPDHGARAAEKHPEQRQDRVLHAGEAGPGIAEEQPVGRPCRGRDGAGNHHRAPLVREGVVAQHAHPFLVLADRHQRPAEGAADQPQAEREATAKSAQARR